MRDLLPMHYQRRFGVDAEERRAVWRVLIAAWFSRYLEGVESVVDVGCGWGPFIDQVDVPTRYGIDLNPDARQHIGPGVEVLEQAADDPWPIDDGTIDLVFTSNFLEHLPSREAIIRTLAEAHRCLRPGGRMVCMGPNIRFVGGAYWDFFDHLVPLTDRSMVEALEVTGLVVDDAVDRFLPFTMAGRRPAPAAAIRAYLRVRPAWRVLGGQFLVVAHRPA